MIISKSYIPAMRSGKTTHHNASGSLLSHSSNWAERGGGGWGGLRAHAGVVTVGTDGKAKHDWTLIVELLFGAALQQYILDEAQTCCHFSVQNIRPFLAY